MWRPPFGVCFRESLVFRLYSEIDQINLSIEAQCGTACLPMGDCHTLAYLTLSDRIFLQVSDKIYFCRYFCTASAETLVADDIADHGVISCMRKQPQRSLWNPMPFIIRQATSIPLNMVILITFVFCTKNYVYRSFLTFPANVSDSSHWVNWPLLQCNNNVDMTVCHTLPIDIITYTTRGKRIWHIYHERNSYPPRPSASGDMSFSHGIYAISFSPSWYK